MDMHPIVKDLVNEYVKHEERGRQMRAAIISVSKVIGDEPETPDMKPILSNLRKSFDD